MLGLQQVRPEEAKDSLLSSLTTGKEGFLQNLRRVSGKDGKGSLESDLALQHLFYSTYISPLTVVWG